MSSSPDQAQAALDILKGKENPFESLARPQRLDDHFLDLHVPELLAEERGLLLQIIDRYRVEEYSRSTDLPPTRVVTVLGDRGAGKTHLLHSLSYRHDRKSQIVVRPSFFDVNLAFEEYLLAQLVAVLVDVDEVFGSRPIEDLAPALTRRLLRQAIRALGPTDRIFWLSPGRWQRLRLLLGGGDWACRVLEDLADALEKTTGAPELPDLLRRHGLDPAKGYRLVQSHLRAFESGPGPLALMRRELYAALARALLLNEKDSLYRFLEGDYTQVDAAGTRQEIVARLLHALIEVCAFGRQPVVFAFDNLERLFSPRNQFDAELTRTFWSMLAQAVDNTRGILVLLLAETGLFEKAASTMDSFARDRLGQGVPIHARGPVSEIRLRPPAPEEIGILIRNRVARLLGSLALAKSLPDGFPFSEAFLRKEVRASQNLRITLTRLRDEYSRCVYQQASRAEAAPPVPWEALLESKWREHLAMATRSLQGSLAGHLPQLHAGLGSMLQPLLPFAPDGWELTQVQTTLSIGDQPNYGLVSLLEWRRRGDPAEAGGSRNVGVGFLLGKGNGMPVDLRAKLDFFRRPAKGDHLLVLWPASREGNNLVELLPPGTSAVWDSSRHKDKATLLRVEMNDLAVLLAFPGWLNSLPGLGDQPVPPETLQAFIKDKAQAILQAILTPAGREERVLIDEN
jgi:hypothetical protein